MSTADSPNVRRFSQLFEPVDLASLIVFRIGFGLIAAWWAVDYLARGRMFMAYIVPRFHFTYYGFDWVQPWPGVGLHIHFIAMAVLGLCIAAGFRYRLASILFALGVTYFFLLDRTNYQNHYYLLVLVSWLLTLLPLHRCWSIDALETPGIRADTVPRWMLWIVRFHIGIPYFFGGVAKFDADWFAGAPFRQTLQAHADLPVIGPWFHEEWVIQVFIWGGLLFDLLVVPALLWKRTRWVAYTASLFFHLMNSQLFSIHIFPWFMMVATTVYFEPDWPRRALRLPAVVQSVASVNGGLSSSRKWLLALLAAYCLFHCVWPFRHLVYPGPANWTEQGHHFAWRMMLRGKQVGIRYYVTDPRTRQTQLLDVREFLSPLQIGVFGRDPEMILHFAHFAAEMYEREFGVRPEVRALVLTSLNGRKPQLQIDPEVDLASQPRGWHRRDWIMPLTEPLPPQPWNVPIEQWEAHVELPTLTFLHRPAD